MPTKGIVLVLLGLVATIMPQSWESLGCIRGSSRTRSNGYIRRLSWPTLADAVFSLRKMLLRHKWHHHKVDLCMHDIITRSWHHHHYLITMESWTNFWVLQMTWADTSFDCWRCKYLVLYSLFYEYKIGYVFSSSTLRSQPSTSTKNLVPSANCFVWWQCWHTRVQPTTATNLISSANWFVRSQDRHTQVQSTTAQGSECVSLKQACVCVQATLVKISWLPALYTISAVL